MVDLERERDEPVLIKGQQVGLVIMVCITTKISTRNNVIARHVVLLAKIVLSYKKNNILKDIVGRAFASCNEFKTNSIG